MTKAIIQKPGTYMGSGQGKEGQISVQVEVSSDQIKKIQALNDFQPESLAGTTFNKMAQKIIQAQSVEVDVISGASETSRGVLAGVQDVLKDAQVDWTRLAESQAKKQPAQLQEVSVDVAVIGAGAAGVAAALAARQAGVTVALLEKTATPLGAGTFAGGMFAGDSQQQKEQRRVVDKKWLYDKYLDASQGYMNSILVRRIIDEAGHTVDWLNENGAVMTLVDAGTGGSFEHESDPATLHGYQAGGTVAITKLIENFVSHGGQMYFNTPAQELITDTNGQVTGVFARQEDGNSIQFNTKKVIIATGGFGGNPVMRQQYLGDVNTPGQVLQNTGDGLQMAWKVGANHEISGSTHYFWQTFAQADIPEMQKLVGSAWFSLNAFGQFPNLRVNIRGQRYSDESHATLFAVHGAELSEQPQQTEYVIFDQAMVDIIKAGGTAAIEEHYGKWKKNRQFYMEFNQPSDTKASIEREQQAFDFTPLLEKLSQTQTVFKGQTLEELAQQIGFDQEKFIQSVAQYNAAIESGHDDLFFSDPSRMIKVTTGPFYAIKNVARNLGTLGGVTIDETMHALDQTGQQIDNLYVTGADASGMYGKAYVDFEGGTLGFAYTSGRLAGIDTAQAVQK